MLVHEPHTLDYCTIKDTKSEEDGKEQTYTDGHLYFFPSSFSPYLYPSFFAPLLNRFHTLAPSELKEV